MEEQQAAKKRKKDISFTMEEEDFSLGANDDEELGDAWTTGSARHTTMESTGESVVSKVSTETLFPPLSQKATS